MIVVSNEDLLMVRRMLLAREVYDWAILKSKEQSVTQAIAIVHGLTMLAGFSSAVGVILSQSELTAVVRRGLIADRRKRKKKGYQIESWEQQARMALRCARGENDPLMRMANLIELRAIAKYFEVSLQSIGTSDAEIDKHSASAVKILKGDAFSTLGFKDVLVTQYLPKFKDPFPRMLNP